VAERGNSYEEKVIDSFMENFPDLYKLTILVNPISHGEIDGTKYQTF